MHRWIIFAALALGFVYPPLPVVAGEQDLPVHLETMWHLDGLASPESVALSSSGDFLYISNVNGEADALDGNGFISRVSLKGEMLEREWASGLDGPKGIDRDGTRLYISDINKVVVVSTENGSILERISVDGARFLNDTAVAPDGTVLVSDSTTGRIHSISEGSAELWLEHELLESLNGLLPEAHRLTATTMVGRLLAIDYNTRAINVLAQGLGDADGIAPIGEGRYLVGEWPGLMHVVAQDGTHKTILDSRDEKLYLNDFLLVGDVLYQPHWEPGKLTAYRVVQSSSD